MTLDEIKALHKAHGGCWFDLGASRFFLSRYSNRTHGRYFVTSERLGDSYPRLYTVRGISDYGYITTVGEFQAYKTAREAHKAAETLHRQEVEKGNSK